MATLFGLAIFALFVLCVVALVQRRRTSPYERRMMPINKERAMIESSGIKGASLLAARTQNDLKKGKAMGITQYRIPGGARNTPRECIASARLYSIESALAKKAPVPPCCAQCTCFIELIVPGLSNP